MMDNAHRGKRLLLHGLPAVEVLQFLDMLGWREGVLVAEMRPLLIGARQVVPLLVQQGIQPTLISDNMIAYCMWRGLVSAAVICYSEVDMVGFRCPSGALGVALCALYHQLPVLALPLHGAAIPPTSAGDLFCFLGQRVAAEGIEAFVPPADLVSWQWISQAWAANGERIGVPESVRGV